MVFEDSDRAEPSRSPSTASAPTEHTSGTVANGSVKRSGMTRVRRKKKPTAGGDSLTHADPSLFINRELSWLEFNERVLEEARDRRHPLLERVKFLSIVSSNLDEFFMIRVAALREQVLANVTEQTPDGRTPLQQLQAIHERVDRMLCDMSSCFWDDLHPALASAGIRLLRMQELTTEEHASLADLFAREIFPVLTPLAFDPGHPFPYISNLSLSLAVVVRTPEGIERFARVKVPDVLSRLVQIPNGDGSSFRFVWLEDLISENLGMLFPGMEVIESYAFRVTRDADIEIQEDEAEDLIRSIEESIRQRRFGSVVRVGVQKTMPERIKTILVENLEITPNEVYQIRPPLGLAHLAVLLKVARPDLKDPPLHAATPFAEEEGDDIFAAIRRSDIILHHPYDSFAPVVHLIRSAARDPNVLAIKQTLYRIGKESPLVPLFIEAAENGKQVAVLVELKARFDEENNIGWAKQLERAGIHVVYGLVGLKTHAKMALIVRREQDGIRRYVHLGTGNYNPVTARIYTDLSFFTCREDITADAVEVFNYLTGYSNRDAYRKLAVAPVNLRERLASLIDREIGHAKAGKPARLIFKMNSLTDVKFIEQLYEASRAGVSVDLIIRGICCLRPGISSLSEHIRVISVVGRFLEHSRVFYFANAGSPEVFLGSADMMGRNLDRRVELIFPVEDPQMAQSLVKEVLETALVDQSRARVLSSDGSYLTPPAATTDRLDSQQVILQSRARAMVQKPPVPREPPPQALIRDER
ncbi:MAG TPA: polyphosphate kinase 1 [Bacteroidota bacterium]|nr:polyphosphate kinase 1 [Bacteroidota bacterium]